MRVQEQAFRAYYASMTDGELLKTAANRSSFVDLAQQILSEELTRRKLALPAEVPPPAERASGTFGSAVHKFLQTLRHNQVHN